MPSSESELSDTFAQYITDNYKALKRYARSRLRGLEGTYQETAVLHEAYAKVVMSCQKKEGGVPSPALLYLAMKQIIIGLARKKKQRREAQDQVRDHAVDVARSTESSLAADHDGNDDLDECLRKLYANHPLAAEVYVLQKIFEVSIEKTAIALDISPATVSRESASAKALLAACLNKKYCPLPPGASS